MELDEQVPPKQLRCPRSGGELKVVGHAVLCASCGPVGLWRGGVWDFVLDADYAASFGAQWTMFSGTQLDSVNFTSISRRRFEEVTGWRASDLVGLEVLDAGCGAGRFSEIAYSFGAKVTSLDLSEAAYAASRNVAGKCTVVRGDVLAPPLAAASFDRVFSIGVLQHTPDPERAAEALLQLLRPGGQLAVWMYESRWYSALLPRNLLRTAATRLSEPRARQLSQLLVRIFTPLARGISFLPAALARRLHACIPIASYWGSLPLNDQQQREWSLLDTQDWLTPRYDQPRTFDEMSAALMAAGASAVHRIPAPGLALIATREPSAAP